MIKDFVSIKGDVSIRVIDQATRQTRQKVQIRNLITEVGKTYLVDRVLGTTSEVISQIGLGDGTTAPDVSQTALTGSNQVFKNLLSLQRPTLEVKSWIASTSFIDEASETPSEDINEIGLFTDQDTMIARTVLSSPVTKAESDILDISWTLTIG
jgi:hypothetical protein